MPRPQEVNRTRPAPGYRPPQPSVIRPDGTATQPQPPSTLDHVDQAIATQTSERQKRNASMVEIAKRSAALKAARAFYQGHRDVPSMALIIAAIRDTFVIEGHASAEGDYAKNLQLSQERAERISRELVRHGVSAERLMPVGYGEAEAASPADAAEADRRLDRRVVVFRMR